MKPAAMASRTTYPSYDEHQVLADAAMRREVEAGFAETGDVAGLTAKYGELVLSKIACIVSDKDGKQKVRLIRDLRRSAVNAGIHLQERLVLPRLSDVISARPYGNRLRHGAS